MTAASAPVSFSVGIDVSSLAGPKTGIARYTYELLGGLQASLPAGSVVPVANRGNVRLPGFDGPSAPAGPKFGSRAAWTFGLLPFWLRAAGIDVYHATSYYAPFGTRVPRVVTIHDLSTFVCPKFHPQARVLRARAVLPAVARSAAAIIVPSRAVKADAIRWLGVENERVHVVPEAPAAEFTRPIATAEVDATLRRYGLEAGFFLTVGGLDPRKNLARVTEALELLASQPGVETPRLVIAGPDGRRMADIERAIERPAIRPFIRRLGFVPDADLRALMAAARALVYPSLYEGFGLPVVEAMAAGLPVLTSSDGALAELAEGAAILVDPHDAESIAAGMRLLVEDEEVGRRLVELGRERAAGHSWARTAHETAALYAAAIEGGRT